MNVISTAAPATILPKKDQRVKVYIQQSSSNYLYSATDGWVRSILQADTFASSVEALNYCIQKDLANVHIRVNSAPECGFDTIISVKEFPYRVKVPAMDERLLPAP
jgi:hypothetical protein